MKSLYNIEDEIVYTVTTPERRSLDDKIVQAKSSITNRAKVIQVYQNPNNQNWFYRVSTEDYWIEESEIKKI